MIACSVSRIIYVLVMFRQQYLVIFSKQLMIFLLIMYIEAMDQTIKIFKSWHRISNYAGAHQINGPMHHR